MASRRFTAEEMAQLRNNEYVLDVTPNTVHFSAMFKEFFWDELLNGKEPVEIVMECGLDPEVLGATRLNGLKSMIKKEFQAGKGFRDLETYRNHRVSFLTPEARIQYLEEKLAFKELELVVLKKIVSLGEGA